MKRAVLIGFAAAALMSAGDPRLEPLTGLPPFPADNPPTPEKIRLGKELFFDEILSGGRRSCSTCHKPELYFTDGFSRAWGLHDMELRRKTPTVLNIGWHESFFFDGRSPTLEKQAAEPIANPLEMNSNPDKAAERIAADPYYQGLFAEAFPGEPITFEQVGKAIAAYERTLIFANSPLDRYLQGDHSALNDAAKRGMELFTGKAGCVRCHNGPLLSDQQKHYTGVKEEMGDNDPGTKYKTQSLRDVMRRYSYMHNGAMLTINDVLDHYVQGGSAPAGLTAEIEPIELSDEDRGDLIAFLKSLDGDVSALLDNSPDATDPFNFRRRRRVTVPVTAEEEEAASSPVLDPNYRKPKR